MKLGIKTGIGGETALGEKANKYTVFPKMLIYSYSYQVRVWSHSKQGAERFCHSVSGPVKMFVSVEEAVRGADAIVTVTRCTEPVLFGQWVKPGAHVAGERKSFRHTRL